MVLKLSRRFQNCRDLSGWLKNLPDGCTTGRIFSDGLKIIQTVSKLMGYFQMISNFPAIGFKIDRMVPDLFKISFGWRTMITLLRLCCDLQLQNARMGFSWQAQKARNCSVESCYPESFGFLCLWLDGKMARWQDGRWLDGMVARWPGGKINNC